MVQTPYIMESNAQLPQVPGNSSSCAVVDGRQTNSGIRGQVNLRAGFSNRQTTTASFIKDSEMLNLLTYNVCTLMQDERLVELENALQDISWDIIGLAEVRRLGEQTIERENNVFFHFGETQGLYGVGFLVAKKWKNNIIEFKGYSERIAALKFRLTHNKTLSIIQTYAPTSTHPNENVEDFYDLLNRACYENRCTYNVVLGDFNAKIGVRQEMDNESIVGPYGLGVRNERGIRLLHFAFGQKMFIANSYFSKKAQRRWTWVAPNPSVKNEIDHVLCSERHIIKDVGVINQIKFSSDHRPVRTKLKFNFQILRAALFSKSKIRNIPKTSLLTHKDQFNLDLSNYFSLLKQDETDNVDKQYNDIVEGIRCTSKKITITKSRNNCKFTSKTLKLIETRSETEIRTQEYSRIDRQVKRSIRKDLRQHNCHLIEEALVKNTSLRVAKQGMSPGKSWINSLMDDEGVKHTNRDKLIEICTKFYKKLYSDPTKNIPDPEYACPNTIPFITGLEVHKSLRSMKYNRSPGEDGITTETLKIGSSTLLPHITNLFNKILLTGKLPSQMCHSNIILLHKKGSKSDISNYRPISLVSHLYKAFIKVILSRIEDTLDKHQPPEQAGFRQSYSTTDHLHTLNQVIEKYLEFNIPLYIAFVDYTKAFDSLTHSSIFSALYNQEIDKTYIDLLKQIYNDSTATIKLENCGPSFKIEKGVKQGDPLSPKLFTSTLEEIFKNLATSWDSRGIIIGDKNLTNLRFADDIILFAPSAQELQQMLQDLSTASLEVGLAMNRSKTQVMTNSIKRRVEVDGQVIQYVDEYIYLGQLVSFQNRQDIEINRRIENAWRSYWSMKQLMKGSLPLTLKRKLIDMCILPILTYGAQTWSLTEAQKSQLKICQRAMERSILGVKRIDRVRNTDLRAKTGIADVGIKTARIKWDWAGHVVRMHPERWANLVTQWIPNGRRNRGRPKKRWRDDLDAFKPDWPELAMDRDGWRGDGETFAQQWDNVG